MKSVYTNMSLNEYAGLATLFLLFFQATFVDLLQWNGIVLIVFESRIKHGC